MKLMRPAPTLPRMREEIDRLFDRFFRSPFLLAEPPEIETAWAPSMDLLETNTDFVIRVEAPGVHKENLDVTLEGNVLTVTGKREFRREDETEEYIWREREEGRFVRSLRLPKPVVADEVSAHTHDGVLTIRLPKKELGAKSKIVIK